MFPDGTSRCGQTRKPQGLEESTVKLTTSLAIAFTLLIATQAVAQSGFYGHENFYGYQCNRFELRSGVKLMDRPGTGQALPVATDINLNTVLLDTAQLSDLNTGVGIENSLTFNQGDGTSWELRGNYIQWEQDDTVFSPGTIFTTGGAFPLDRVDADAQSDFFKLELNYKRTVMNGVQFLIGPTFSNFRDQLSYLQSGVVTGNPLFPAPPLNVTILDEIEGRNRMLGYHIGTDLRLNLTGRIYVTGTLRAGQFINPAKLVRVTDSSLALSTVRTSIDETKDGFQAEVGGRVHWDVFTGKLSCYAGYEANWVDGVVIATSSFSSTAGGIPTDTLFFQGAVFGVTFKR